MDEKDTKKKLSEQFAQAGEAIKKAGNAAAEAADSAKNAVVAAVDKNGDGKINRDDFGLGDENIQEAKEKAQQLAVAAGENAADLAGKASEKIRDTSAFVGSALEKAKFELDRKTLRPVFPEEFEVGKDEIESSIQMRTQRQSMVCLVPRDKKRSESPACQGAIGYRESIKGLEVLNIYIDAATHVGMWFYPNIAQTVYYIDPYKASYYISLDEYFSYIKKARVNELEIIAQDLGAKRVRISFKEDEKTLVAKHTRGDAKAQKMNGSVEQTTSETNASRLEIASDVKFSGHDTPHRPEVIYFKDESDIEKLIQMRLSDGANKVESKTYHFRCSSLSGMKESEAVKIDAVLQQKKMAGTASISSEAQRESRTELEYAIEF